MRDGMQARCTVPWCKHFCAIGASTARVGHFLCAPPAPVCVLTVWTVRAKCTGGCIYILHCTCIVHRWVHFHCILQTQTLLKCAPTVYYMHRRFVSAERFVPLLHTRCAKWASGARRARLVQRTCAYIPPAVHSCAEILLLTALFWLQNELMCCTMRVNAKFWLNNALMAQNIASVVQCCDEKGQSTPVFVYTNAPLFLITERLLMYGRTHARQPSQLISFMQIFDLEFGSWGLNTQHDDNITESENICPSLGRATIVSMSFCDRTHRAGQISWMWTGEMYDKPASHLTSILRPR